MALSLCNIVVRLLWYFLTPSLATYLQGNDPASVKNYEELKNENTTKMSLYKGLCELVSAFWAELAMSRASRHKHNDAVKRDPQDLVT